VSFRVDACNDLRVILSSGALGRAVRLLAIPVPLVTPLMTDMNTSAYYPNPLQREARTINRYEFVVHEGWLAEGQEKEMKYTVPGNSSLSEGSLMFSDRGETKL
jgi:hypothetical protein